MCVHAYIQPSVGRVAQIAESIFFLSIAVTTMLDILEDWATEYKGWRICRIDGTTKQDDRRAQMKSFNEETGPDCKC
jgi:hypothetical protein